MTTGAGSVTSQATRPCRDSACHPSSAADTAQAYTSHTRLYAQFTLLCTQNAPKKITAALSAPPTAFNFVVFYRPSETSPCVGALMNVQQTTDTPGQHDASTPTRARRIARSRAPSLSTRKGQRRGCAKEQSPRLGPSHLSGWKARNEISLPMCVYILASVGITASPTVLITRFQPHCRSRNARHASLHSTAAADEYVDKTERSCTPRRVVAPGLRGDVIGHARADARHYSSARRLALTRSKKPALRLRPLAEETRNGDFPRIACYVAKTESGPVRALSLVVAPCAAALFAARAPPKLTRFCAEGTLSRHVYCGCILQ